METEPETEQNTRTLRVPEAEDGRPLLEFLSRCIINESKTRMRRLIGSGRILLNGCAGPTTRRVSPGDEVTVPAQLDMSGPPEQQMELNVLHYGPDHICVNKPPGVPVLPGRGGHGAEFFESLVARLNRDAPDGGPYERPHVVHRLDKDTSGVLLVARNVKAGRRLSMQFQKRKVSKTYIALVEGPFPRNTLEIDIPLARQKGSVVRMRTVERRGKEASTRVEVAERFGHFTLLRVQPHTGRQHQIRVHLSAVGYPLVVDHLYGRREQLTQGALAGIVGTGAAGGSHVLLDRLPLHAESIEYTDPTTGRSARHSAPLPQDIEELLAHLRKVDPSGASH